MRNFLVACVFLFGMFHGVCMAQISITDQMRERAMQLSADLDPSNDLLIARIEVFFLDWPFAQAWYEANEPELFAKLSIFAKGSDQLVRTALENRDSALQSLPYAGVYSFDLFSKVDAIMREPFEVSARRSYALLSMLGESEKAFREYVAHKPADMQPFGSMLPREIHLQIGREFPDYAEAYVHSLLTDSTIMRAGSYSVVRESKRDGGLLSTRVDVFKE